MEHISLWFLLGICILGCEGYKIFAIFPQPARSHYAISSNLLNALARKGHQVTVATPFIQENPKKNLNEISLASVVDVINVQVKSKLFELEQGDEFAQAKFYMEMGCIVTEHVLQHDNIQKILQKNEKYDLIILPEYVNEALLGVAYHFKAPTVLVSTMPLFPWSDFLLAHPTPPSYVPNLFSRYTGHMNFWQRLTNSFYDARMILYHQWAILPKHREWVRKYIPGKPDLYEFLNNASLLLINSHMSSYEAMPQIPNVIEVGGLHINKPEKLPEDLQKFLDDSVEGVVIFSLGSNLKSSDMPPEQRDGVLRAFSKLKQNVLWKWEEDSLPGQPKNVKLMKWLPQSDVLAHPNVKALINHGGLLSTMEAVYYGKPFIGIPFFGDQKMNMATAVAYEYGIKISLPELNEETLSRALNEVLNNPKYKNNIQKRSRIMQDTPMTPLDAAVYWIEYVARHKGASHLRYPGADLTWYQRNLLDVVGFVVLTTTVFIAFIIFVIRTTSKKICKAKPTNKKKKNN